MKLHYYLKTQNLKQIVEPNEGDVKVNVVMPDGSIKQGKIIYPNDCIVALKEWKFDIDMIDHWSASDYQTYNELSDAIKEVQNALF